MQHSCFTCCNSIPFEVSNHHEVGNKYIKWYRTLDSEPISTLSTSSFCSLAFEKSTYPSPFEPPGPTGSHRGQCCPRCTQDESASRYAWRTAWVWRYWGRISMQCLRVFDVIFLQYYGSWFDQLWKLPRLPVISFQNQAHFTVMTSMLQCVCLPKPHLRNKSSKCVVYECSASQGQKENLLRLWNGNVALLVANTSRPWGPQSVRITTSIGHHVHFYRSIPAWSIFGLPFPSQSFDCENVSTNKALGFMTMTTASMWIGGLGCPDSERELKLTISRIIITKILLERQKTCDKHTLPVSYDHDQQDQQVHATRTHGNHVESLRRSKSHLNQLPE